MSYTGTHGQTGNGSLFQINTGTASSPTYTTVGESIDITPNGFENKTDDGTNLSSTAVERVFTIADGGTWEFTANRVSTDVGQAAMATAFASGATTQFKITLPLEVGQTVAGDVFAFHAIVTKWSPSIKVDKIVKIAGACATTNGITVTLGS